MSKNEIQNNKLLILGKLSASLAHEIRNPLSALKLNLNYLKMSDDQFNDEMAECIGSCLEATERIEILIENTLEFSRSPVKNDGYISVNYLAEQSIGILEGTAKKKGVEIKSNLKNNVPELILNKNKVLQVFINIINNAIEASDKKSIIEVNSYKNTAGNIVFEVNDSGTGIKEEIKDKIFDDFFTNKRQGTGLGLSVCKKILDEHEAEIKFESAEDKGTTFKIIFPKKIAKTK